jgi:hypothetical protein
LTARHEHSARAALSKTGTESAELVASGSLDLLYVNCVIFAETRFGIERATDANQRAEPHDWLVAGASGHEHGGHRPAGSL